MDELFALDDADDNEMLKIFKSLYFIGVLSSLIQRSHEDFKKADEPANGLYSSCIVRSMEYIQKNYYEKLTVEQLAKAANMSRSSYLRHFNNTCKCSPQEYLTKIRISKAAELLKDPSRSITSIAQDCGFFDCSHFIRLFKKVNGVTPSAYRKSHTIKS